MSYDEITQESNKKNVNYPYYLTQHIGVLALFLQT